MMPHPKIILTKTYVSVKNASSVCKSSYIKYYPLHIILPPISFKNINPIKCVSFYEIPS